MQKIPIKPPASEKDQDPNPKPTSDLQSRLATPEGLQPKEPELTRATPSQLDLMNAKSRRSVWQVLRLYPLPPLALVLLLVSLAFWLAGRNDIAQWPLLLTIVIGGAPLCWEIVRQIIHRELGVDLIAILAIGGSLLLREYLAGALVVLMLSGGEALENYALQRARSSLAALTERSPHWAHIRHGDQLETVEANTIQSGMEIVIKPGELSPVDGIVIGGAANFSEADLTGEPLPVRKEIGGQILSGSVDLDGVLDVRAVRPAAESHYAQIVRLVEEAQKSKAPIHRIADRYAVWFTGLSLIIAALAWVFSHDSVYALAVLVVATPCPLILATPIAIMSGMNQAAKMGLIVKGGAVMEQLGEVDVAVFDKTGTLTLGQPALVDIEFAEEVSVMTSDSAPETAAEASSETASATLNAVMMNQRARDLLQLAASVEQLSVHILASAVVQAAVERGIPLLAATNMKEISGKGVQASIVKHEDTAHQSEEAEERSWRSKQGSTNENEQFTATQPLTVAVGNRTFLRSLSIPLPENLAMKRTNLAENGKIASFVAVNGQVVALLVFADTPRPEVALLTPALHKAGIIQTTLLTGDSEAVAKQVGTLAGMDKIVAHCLPQDKVNVIAALQAEGRQVLMVGDGVNDAPALALAKVGVAVGVQGVNASAAVADAVLISTNILTIAAAVRLGRYVLHIAKQGIWLGIGLSIVAMLFAAVGYIPPAVGAILQEGIDVLVILNALRAGRPMHVE